MREDMHVSVCVRARWHALCAYGCVCEGMRASVSVRASMRSCLYTNQGIHQQATVTKSYEYIPKSKKTSCKIFHCSFKVHVFHGRFYFLFH